MTQYSLSKIKVGYIDKKAIFLYSIWNENTQECICDFQGNEEGSNIKARQKAKEKLKELNQQEVLK